MANVITRWVRAVYDRAAGKKVEAELQDSLTSAGKKGGEGFLKELRTAFATRMADLKTQLARGLIDPAEFKQQADVAAKAFNTGMLAAIDKARAAGTLTDAEFLSLSRTLKTVGDTGSTSGGLLASAFTKAGVALAAFFSARKVLDFFAESVHLAIEAEASYGRLDTVLKPLGLRYTQVRGEVERYLTTLQNTTRFSDEDGREALVNLVTITGDYRLSLSLLDVTADIAAKRHITMAEAAETAGKAARGMSRGMADLGIVTGETGNLIGKIRTNLRGLAEQEGKEVGGQLKTLNNLWSEFQEKIGAAIIGSGDATSATARLKDGLIALNEWADKNSATIGRIAGWFATIANGAIWIAEFLPKIWEAGKTVPGLQLLELGIELLGKATVKTAKETVESVHAIADAWAMGLFARRAKTTEEIKAEEEAAKARAAELVRIEEELAIARLRIEKGGTEAVAREEVRRRSLLQPGVPREAATVAELQAGWKALDQANLKLAAGFEGTLTPAIKRTETQLMSLRHSMETFPAAKVSMQFTSPWVGALGLLQADLKSMGQDFLDQIASEWAEGGIAGLVKYAKAKIKQNVAAAIEAAAEALFSAAFGDEANAAKFSASAAAHTAAAAAWGVLAGTSGGGAGAAGVGPAGGEPNLGASTAAEPRGPDITIILEGPGFDAMNPRVQRVLLGAMENAREIYGRNAQVSVKRGGH